MERISVLTELLSSHPGEAVGAFGIIGMIAMALEVRRVHRQSLRLATIQIPHMLKLYEAIHALERIAAPIIAAKNPVLPEANK